MIFQSMALKLVKLFIPLILTSLLISCHNDKVLLGCCSNPAIDENVGNGHIYVPNIFTPNADGINDNFTVFGDFNILIIREMKIKNQNGELVFKATDINPNVPSEGWDGTSFGLRFQGIFSFSIKVETSDGTVKTLEGNVCNYPCGEADNLQVGHPNDCQFPSQVFSGLYDPTLPSFENFDCFE